MAAKGGVRASSVGSGRQNKGSNCLDTSTGAAIHKCAWPCAGKQIEQNTLPPPHHLPHHRKYIASSTFSEQSQLRPTNLQKKRSLPSKIYPNNPSCAQHLFLETQAASTLCLASSRPTLARILGSGRQEQANCKCYAWNPGVWPPGRFWGLAATQHEHLHQSDKAQKSVSETHLSLFNRWIGIKL